MRITSAGSYQSLLSSIQSIEQRMQQDQTEITSGNRINQPSDDPAGAADVVRLTGEKAEIDQYTSNAAAGRDRLNFTDSVLSNVQTMRNIGLGTNANPSVYTTEMNSLRDQIVSTANSSFQGSYLFGGTVADKPPYAVQPDRSVTYQGNSNVTKVQVGGSSTLQVQIPGDQVFSGPINVFDGIKQLSDAITSGDKTGQSSAVFRLCFCRPHASRFAD
jgi:flagellar hook-associated protein 3 FlgL